jgi:catechol 2,3-dioxygenase-like lactoylglutathione lyase family enzyme
MAKGDQSHDVGPGMRARASGVVLFVADLDRSADFYRDLLGFEVIVREGEAMILEDRAEFHLCLRAMSRAEHASASIGVQYCAWTLDSTEALTRAEAWLRAQSSLVSRSVFEGIDVIEGRDPDGIPVVLHVPALDHRWPSSVLPRIYAY